MSHLDLPRRSVLVTGAATATTAATAATGRAHGLLARDAAAATHRDRSRFFRHGVASGDPHPGSVVLWTRLTPTPDATPGSGRGPRSVVTWEVARDAAFRRVVRRGRFTTAADRDHTVKLEADGLRPATTYHFRFGYRGQHSAVGTTRTAPAPDASPARLRFGVVSCANLPAGHFSAYRHLAARRDLDAVIHLGDYLYEYGPQEGDLRAVEPPHEMVSLADYRQRHAAYKLDPDLQALHARVPFIVAFDDHEVTNDSWSGGAENHSAAEGDYARRRAAALRAYDEWMPVRLGGTARTGDGTRLFRTLRFGRLAELDMLDLRTYRDAQITTPLPFPLPQLHVAADDPDRTITGAQQMAWLKRRLRQSTARWKLIGNSVMIAPLSLAQLPRDAVAAVNQVTRELPSDGIPLNLDQWDGYGADRRELFDHLAEHAITDTVFLTGDIHSAWANDCPLDPGSYPLSRSVAVEFVCTSVTSDNIDDILGVPPRTATLAVEALLQTTNRHVKYLNFDDHGFSVLDVTAERTQMDYFVVSDRRDPRAGVAWTASWATAAGSQKVHAVDAPVRP